MRTRRPLVSSMSETAARAFGVERSARLRELLEVQPVDQVDDLHVARQQPLHHGDRPGLDRLGQSVWLV